MDEFKDFLDNLVYWFSEQHSIDAAYKINGTIADVGLLMQDEEEGEDEFYIGSYAEPGMQVVWLGSHKLPDKEESENLVRVNGVVMSAFGKHVVGWAVGFE